MPVNVTESFEQTRKKDALNFKQHWWRAQLESRWLYEEKLWVREKKSVTLKCGLTQIVAFQDTHADTLCVYPNKCWRELVQYNDNVSDGLLSLITKHWRESRPLLSSGFNVCGLHALRIMALTCCQSEWQLMNSNPALFQSFCSGTLRICRTHSLPAADPDPAALCAQRVPVS